MRTLRQIGLSAALVFVGLVPGYATTVTGTLKDLSATPLTSSAYVTFDLVNTGAAIPRVSGTNVIVPVTYTATPDGTGAFSVTIQDNATITPAGTYYRVCEYGNGQKLHCDYYTITGATVDLSSLTPINIAPVVTPPTGDTTYLRVDAGNQNLLTSPTAHPFVFGPLTAEGNLTVAGSEIIGGTQTKQISGGPELVSFQNAAANHVIYGGWVTGEANARHLDSINGFEEWGPGGSSDQDVALFRNWAGGLAIQSFNGTPSDHTFAVLKPTIGGGLGQALFRVDSVANLVSIESGAKLAVNGASGGAPVDVVGAAGGNGVRVQAASGDVAYSSFLSADNFARFAVLGSGTTTIGGGTTVGDVTLSRPVAGQYNVTGVVGLATATPTDNFARIFLDNANNRLLIGSGAAPGDSGFQRLSTGNIEIFAGGGTVAVATNSPTTGQALEVNGGVALSTGVAQPTCSATIDGTFWFVKGSSGVKDSASVCAKDAANAYAWRTIY